MRCLGDTLIVAAEAVAPFLLVAQFGSIAGWSAPEVVMLIGIGRVGEGIALAVGRGVDPTVFSTTVRLGLFDQVLTRPISPLGWLLTTEVELRHVFRAVAGAGIICVAARSADVGLTPVNVLVLLAACAASALFVLSILVMGAALTFRTVEGSDVANLAANGGIGLVSFPLDVYGSALRFVFTFLLPVGLCVYVPMLFVLHRDGPGVLGPGLLPAMPIGVAVLVGAALLCWRAGLRHYQSTGS